MCQYRGPWPATRTHLDVQETVRRSHDLGLALHSKLALIKPLEKLEKEGTSDFPSNPNHSASNLSDMAAIEIGITLKFGRGFSGLTKEFSWRAVVLDVQSLTLHEGN